MSGEVVQMISRSTECFVETLARSAGAIASVNGRRTILLTDLAEAVRRDDRLLFTQDLIPVPIPLDEAIALQKEKGIDVPTSKQATESHSNDPNASNILKDSTSHDSGNSSGNSSVLRVVGEEDE